MKIEELNLSAVKYFIDAVQFESFTKSAQKNFVSRPAVSQAILRLEQWCGKPLLKHKKKSFELTPFGKNFYQNIQDAYLNFQNSVTLKRKDVNSLRIGCSTSLLDFVFPKIEKILKRSETPVIKFGTTDQLMRELRDGTINIALAVDHGKESSFKRVNFHSGKFRAVSKSGLFENHLVTTDDRPEIASFQKFAVKNKIHFKTHTRVEIWMLAVRFVQLSSGVCVAPDCIESKGLKIITAPEWEFPYSAAIFFRNKNDISSLEQALIDRLVQGDR
jgi:DNA-binding transcriptional LysR family regulator